MTFFERFKRLTIWNKVAFLGSVASLVGTAVTIFAVFSQAEQVMAPRFAVDAHDLLVKKGEKPEELKITWRGEEFTNLYTARIAIWNQGRRTIEKTSISKTDPIRVQFPPHIRVLSAEFMKTSRPNLKLQSQVGMHEGQPAVHVEMMGDDALERHDGGVVQLLYTKVPHDQGFGHVRGEFKKDPDDFVVTGRIKASEGDFQPVPWNTARSASTHAAIRWLASVFVMVFGGMQLLLVGRMFYKIKTESSGKWQILMGSLVAVLFMVGVIWVFYQFFAEIFWDGPVWIS